MMQDEERIATLTLLDTLLAKSMTAPYQELVDQVETEIITYDFFEDLELILDHFDYDEQRLLIHFLALLEVWHTQKDQIDS